MRGQHAGARLPLSPSGSSGGCSSARRARARSGRAATPPGTQQHRLVETADNGGFDADVYRAGIDDQIDAPHRSL